MIIYAALQLSISLGYDFKGPSESSVKEEHEVWWFSTLQLFFLPIAVLSPFSYGHQQTALKGPNAWRGIISASAVLPTIAAVSLLDVNLLQTVQVPGPQHPYPVTLHKLHSMSLFHPDLLLQKRM